MSSGIVVNVDFENIQSIKKGSITLKDNAINIKYGYNGLGKSSIGKAIEYSINNDSERFKFLTPYTGEEPSIDISNKYNLCSSFNKDFIDSWLFKASNEIIDDSYTVFYNGDSVKKQEEDINDRLKNLAKSLQDEQILNYVAKCREINSNIKFKSHNTAFDARSVVGSGFKNGPAFIKKVEESELANYSKLISLSNSPQWFKWFSDGKNYVVDNKCPYCLNELSDDFSDIQTCIEKLVKENDFKKNNTAKETILKLASITDKTDREKIKSINEMKDQLDAGIITLISEKINKANAEMDKINNLIYQKKFSIGSADETTILNFYNSNRLDESFFEEIGEDLYSSIKTINGCIDDVISQINDIFNAINKFNLELAESTNNVNNEINNFLKFSGIPYKFEIKVLEDGKSQTVIKPIQNDSMIVEEIERHLSYGEINSFSLALFGAINKRSDSDFIILDDPISSFDENKKFAVMHYLFNPEDGVLKDKTILLLTHDMEPILDMVRKDFVNGRKATNPKKICAHLILNDNGIVSEKEITKNDIKNTIQQELDLANNSSIDTYLRVIHLRRYYDLNAVDHESNEYQMASNAEHLRVKPLYKGKKGTREMDPGDVLDGCNAILKHINPFDYDAFISKYTDRELLNLYVLPTSSNYDKIRIIRPLLDHNKSVDKDMKLWNFITENYHVENMYLYGICDNKQIPDYIIRLCDELINELNKII